MAQMKSKSMRSISSIQDLPSMSLGFELSMFSDDGPTAVRDNLNSNNGRLIFVDAQHVETKKEGNSSSLSLSDEPQPADIHHTIMIKNIDDKSDDEFDDNDIYNKSPKIISTFKNDNFDIVSLGAIPLKIKDIAIETESFALEYLQCALPDLHSFFYQIVWKQILESKRNVKCANFRATKRSIKNVMNNGGCKVLQFMAHCCNPSEIELMSNHPYKHLINPEIRNNNQDYVLLEYDNNMIEGEWLNIDELRLLFDANKNDILIVLSPQHNKMMDIFSSLNYKYIIAIQTFNENCEKYKRDKNNLKINEFITHFYGAILDGECIQRSFELAMTASNEKSKEIQHDVLKKMVSSDSEMSAIKKAENNMMIQPQKSIAHYNRFRLYIANNYNYNIYNSRFVVFHDYMHNEPMDVSNLSLCTSCAHLQLQRPFIGRSQEIVHLYNAIKQYEIISCIGRKNYGRRTIIMKLMNYLQQHSYFKHGVIVIDCEQEQKQNQSHILFQDIMKLLLYQQCISMRSLSNDNNNNNMSALSLHDIPSDSTIVDIIDEIKEEFSNKVSLCVVILNVDSWKNEDPRKWIKQFVKKLPKSKVIYTEDRDHIINSFGRLPLQNIDSKDSNISEIVTPHHPSSYYFKAMQKLFTVPFTAINIDILSISKISELFMNLISINHPQFSIDDITSHDGLQKVFNGKARFVKKTAAFISNLQMEESEVLTLDAICNKLEELPNKWVPKAMPIKVDHSRSISPTNFNFLSSPSQIQYGVSIQQKKQDSALKIIINGQMTRYESWRSNHSLIFTPPEQLNYNYGHNDTPYPVGYPPQPTAIAVNYCILTPPISSNSNQSNHTLRPILTSYPSLPSPSNNEQTIKQIKNATNIQELLPFITEKYFIEIQKMLLNDIKTEVKHDENINKNDSQNTINKNDSDEINGKRSNHTLPRISTFTSCPSMPKLPSIPSNSNQFKEKRINNVTAMNTIKHSVQLSQTIGIDDIESCSAEIHQNKRDNELLLKMDKKLGEIWRRECCNHNESIAQISNLQNDFKNKFISITKLNKYKIPTLTKLNKYYLKAFEITNYKQLHNELIIDIGHFQRFWEFLDGICIIISKCKKIYNIENDDNLKINDLGLLIGKNNAQSILGKKQNIKRGAFLLYFGRNPFEINLLYNIHSTDSILKEIVFKYSKEKKNYTIFKNGETETIKKLSVFIKNKQELKSFYCTQKQRLIDKKKVFDLKNNK